MYEICKQFKFSAAHKLQNKSMTEQWNKSVYGPCVNLHGHNYLLEIFLRSDTLKNDMIMNFSDVKTIVNQVIIQKLDHSSQDKTIDEILNIISTAENLSRYIYIMLKDSIPELSKVRLWETDTAYAEYYE